MRTLLTILLLAPLAVLAQGWRGTPFPDEHTRLWSYDGEPRFIVRDWGDGVKRVRPWPGNEYRPFKPMPPLQIRRYQPIEPDYYGDPFWLNDY